MTDLRFPPHQEVRDVLQIEGHELPITLYRQPQTFGLAGELQFFYMQPTDLRAIQGGNQETNFQSIMTFRWLQMLADKKETDREELATFLLGYAFSVFRKHRTLQQVYRDSFLRPKFKLSDIVLGREEIERIRRICADRDRESIRRELSTLFELEPPTREQAAALKLTCEHWLGCGVQKFRKEGWEGLLSWLSELEKWVQKFRKDAKTPPLLRDSLNRFGNLAKTAFYGCYANFWGFLIPWLREHYQLDDVSARLLGIWHNQNQPIVVGVAPSASRILVPRASGRLIIDERGVLHGVRVDGTQIGPRSVPDAFAGQVLALHPLTWFLFANERLCDLVGQFLVSPTFSPIMDRRTTPSSDYLEFVQAIIEAAHLYHQARRVDESRRHDRPHRMLDPNSVAEADLDDGHTVADVREVVRHHLGLCSDCRSELQLIDIEELPDAATLRLTLECRGCGLVSTPELSRSELQSWLGE